MFLIISTFSILSAQSLLEYRKGAVFCHSEMHTDSLKVYLSATYHADESDISVSGDYEIAAGRHVFTPIIPFQIGQKYTALYGTEKLEFQIPIPANYRIPSLIHIYPSDDTLPSNLLKLHVQFSRSMSRIAYPNIELLDENGQAVERAILREIPELWNDNITVLTIWLEPGRIKRGLGPNIELGPVLKKNKKYTLFISSRFRDENGVELDQKYEKKFAAKGADRTKPDISDVQVTYYSEIDWVSVKFGEAMDYSSCISNLKVTDSNNVVIEGFWQLTDGEKEAIFTTQSKLKTGLYKVHINAVIEDLAGNNFKRNFDQEISEAVEKESRQQFILSFEVK